MTVESPAPARALGLPIFSAEDVTKEFGGLVAGQPGPGRHPARVDRVDYRPNGAGKTTFFLGFVQSRIASHRLADPFVRQLPR